MLKSQSWFCIPGLNQARILNIVHMELKKICIYKWTCGLPVWLSWLRICLQCERPRFDPWVGTIPWRRERLPTPVFWPGEFHGLYSPGGRKESDTTEQLSHTHKWTCTIQKCSHNCGELTGTGPSLEFCLIFILCIYLCLCWVFTAARAFL